MRRDAGDTHIVIVELIQIVIIHVPHRGNQFDHAEVSDRVVSQLLGDDVVSAPSFGEEDLQPWASEPRVRLQQFAIQLEQRVESIPVGTPVKPRKPVKPVTPVKPAKSVTPVTPVTRADSVMSEESNTNRFAKKPTVTPDPQQPDLF